LFHVIRLLKIKLKDDELKKRRIIHILMNNLIYRTSTIKESIFEMKINNYQEETSQGKKLRLVTRTRKKRKLEVRKM